jgi:hypothetical protein
MWIGGAVKRVGRSGEEEDRRCWLPLLGGCLGGRFLSGVEYIPCLSRSRSLSTESRALPFPTEVPAHVPEEPEEAVGEEGFLVGEVKIFFAISFKWSCWELLDCCEVTEGEVNIVSFS